ncbi:aldehyde dehydrogenase family protein [Pseudomonas fluorescens]|uniref:aldehyde dehydrogenase family protein n=1 Tax=Pseudomonas fluorescens TaxID=294 RepID=UPI000B2E0DB1|nr:aldehyde dehydrogenase family protein [Pseudomonas fluorescens]
MAILNSSLKTLFSELVGPYDFVGSFVGGALIEGGGESIVINDAGSGQVAFTYADATPDVVRRAIESSHHAQKLWAQFPAREKSKALRALGAAVRDHGQALAQLESISCGKVLKGSLAQVELVADMFDYYAGWTDKFTGDVIPVPGGQLNYTVHEPLGTVLQVVPWNSPLYLAAWNAAPALAMGNAVVIKPSELTPLTALALAHLAIQVGLPAGLVNIICGYGQTTVPPAVADHRIKKVVFVGSTVIGRIVAADAAARPIPCMLELGGKSANIVFADADLEKAAEAAVMAGYANTGQNCAAGSRLLVERAVYRQFQKLLKVASARYVIGSPMDARTDIGPVVSASQQHRIVEKIASGIEEGAEVLVGGGSIPSLSGYFVEPTILVNVNNAMEVARNEIFGPVICVIPFDSEDQAIEIANDSEFALAGGVWTNDIAKGHRVASKINAGLLWINMYREMHVSSPFGGNDSSGFGRSSGADCLHEYTKIKSVWLPFKNS